MKKATVTVIQTGDVSRRLALDLKKAGMKVAVRRSIPSRQGSSYRSGDLILHVLSNCSMKQALDANRRYAKAGFRWLPVEVGKGYASVGPLVEGGEGPCYECLYIRRVEVEAESPRFTKAVSIGQPLQRILSYLCDTYIKRAATEHRGAQCRSARYVVNWDDLDVRKDWVIRHNMCGVCHKPSKKKQIKLVSRMRSYSLGGLRAISAEKTLARSRHLIGEYGPVIDLRNDRCVGFPVSSAYSSIPYSIIRNTDDRSYPIHVGKGYIETQSAVSALAETIERVSASYPDRYGVVQSTPSELTGRSVPIKDLIYNIEEICPAYEETCLEWTRAHSPVEKRDYLIPMEFTCVPYFPSNGAQRVTWLHHSTNGYSSGNNYEEAVLQGMLECIERHNWWISRLSDKFIREVEIDSIDYDEFHGMKRRLLAKGIGVRIFCISGEIQIPTFCSILSSLDGAPPAYSAGYGCHTDPRIGVERALTESIQIRYMQECQLKGGDGVMPMRKITESGCGDVDEMREEDRLLYSAFADIGRIVLRPYLETTHSISMQSIDCFRSKNLKAHIDYIMKFLDKEGCKVLLVDKSIKGYYFKVVKVIVTNLQPPVGAVVTRRYVRYLPQTKRATLIKGQPLG
jgi:bacteriocin biosynthesis cyclodehydratase domain-containing protein